MAHRSIPVAQLPSGRWQVRYRDDTGRQRAATFRTQREAKQFIDIMLPVIGDVPLGRLRTSQLQALVTGLRTKSGRPLESSTAHVVRQHLVQILAAAVADRVIVTNPATAVKVTDGAPVEVVIPQPDEVAAILSAMMTARVALSPSARTWAAAGRSIRPVHRPGGLPAAHREDRPPAHPARAWLNAGQA